VLDAGGLKEYNCSRCGDTYTEIVKQLGHNYERDPDKSREPDCRTEWHTSPPHRSACMCGA